jgi:hypothetical protein
MADVITLEPTFKMNTYRLREDLPLLTIKQGKVTRRVKRVPEEAISSSEVVYTPFVCQDTAHFYIPVEIWNFMHDVPTSVQRIAALLDRYGRAQAQIPEKGNNFGMTSNPILLAQEFSRAAYNFDFFVTPRMVQKAQGIVRGRK